jgi:hypothetical protein
MSFGGGDSFGGSIFADNRFNAYVWNEGNRIELKTLVRNTRGLRLTIVIGMNERGDIGCTAVDGDGARHAVLLTPA